MRTRTPVTCRRVLLAVAGFELLAITAGGALAQVSTGTLRKATFNVDTRIVLVPATVLNRKGALVGGLPSDAFQVTQDNAQRPIVSFGEEDVPVSLAIVLDTSGSMSPVLREAKDTLRAFLDASNPEDEACLFTVSSRPEKESGFTRDPGILLGKTLFSGAGGSTALVDTIHEGFEEMRSALHPRRAMLIISDGMDNHSRFSPAELMAAAVESDLQIYSISIYDPPRNKKPIELAEEANGINFLEELTRRTGGVQLVVRNHAEIPGAANRIGRILRDQYVIGFVPDGRHDDGKWHTIKVSVKADGAKAYARSGFYAR